MNKRIKKNTNHARKDYFMDMVIASVEGRQLFITSTTAERIRRRKKETVKMLEDYQKKYPDFKVTISDEYFNWVFTEYLRMSIPSLLKIL